jgi:hypothetical protein
MSRPERKTGSRRRAADLFDTRWLELPTRPVDQKVFQDKPPLPAVQRPATVRALNLTVGRRRISFDTNQLVLRIAVWTFE